MTKSVIIQTFISFRKNAHQQGPAWAQQFIYKTWDENANCRFTDKVKQ